MSLNSFFRFPELALELRRRIWDYAIAIHVQDITNGLPPWFENPWAERRRQALAGGISGKPKLALCVRILDPYKGMKLRLEEDDFETLVDCLPISAVSYEVRICVSEFCQLLVPHVQFKYETTPLWSLKPPTKDTRPVLLRSLEWSCEAETLAHVFPQPTTLTVLMGEFESAEHFVELVSRFFGNRLQRLVLDQAIDNIASFERAYWPSTSKTPEIL